MKAALEPEQKQLRTKSALQAIRSGDADALKKLLQAGVGATVTLSTGIKNEATSSLLYHAVAKQDVALTNMLLDHGVDVNGGSKLESYPPLRAAVVRSNAELITLLLARGADVNRRYTTVSGRHKVTKTVIFETSRDDAFRLLLQGGADVEARNSWHETPLQVHSFNWNASLVCLLVEHGADVNAVNKKMHTALDKAIFRKTTQRNIDDEEFMKVCRVLLQHRAEVSWTDVDKYFQANGGPDLDPDIINPRIQLVHQWASQRKSGVAKLTVLPVEVFRRGAPDIATYFAAIGKRGLITSYLPNPCDTLQFGSRGAKTPPKCTSEGLSGGCRNGPRLKGTTSDIDLENRLNAHSNASTPENKPGDLAGTDHVGNDVVQHRLYRRKVCVVGPSQWGKTSFIKSFTSGTSVLEDIDTRTIGIDMFPWSFTAETESGNCEYQISFWDFAGQEEYRAVHSLFYSPRTLYLLCVNLEQYEHFIEASTLAGDEEINDRALNTFVEQHIMLWVRMICAQHPQAEFAFIGTKADVLRHDPDRIHPIQEDIVMRFRSRTRQINRNIQFALEKLEKNKFKIQEKDPSAETCELDEQITKCGKLLRNQPTLLSDELILFSSADLTGARAAHDKLKTLLVKSDKSILLPSSYADLLYYVLQQKSVPTSPGRAKSFQSRRERTFLLLSEFTTAVTTSSEVEISESDVVGGLHLLHDTGDILWFDGVSHSPALQTQLFLDPMVVVEFIRQIVNHNISTGGMKHGYISHEQLRALPYWSEIDIRTMEQLKQLLLHLNLAYPAGEAGTMSWNSDLIVPVYWKGAHVTPANKGIGADIDALTGLNEHVRWKYVFEPSMPENLFEKLAVMTYSPLLSPKRSYARDGFSVSQPEEYRAEVVKKGANSLPGESSTMETMETMNALVVTVEAVDRRLAWKQLVWYCLNLERLLKSYSGLFVTRYTVNRDGEQFNVDKLLCNPELLEQIDVCTNQEYLPVDMTWYTKRPSHDSSSQKSTMDVFESDRVAQLVRMDQLGGATNEEVFALYMKLMDARFEQLQRAQTNLITGMETRAKFPSLWTLEYQDVDEPADSSLSLSAIKKKATAKMELKFRSDLSGRCHHEPIEIRVVSSVFARYGNYLKAGLNLLSAAVPDFCGKDVVALIASEANNQINRSQAFHKVLHQAGVTGDEATGSQAMGQSCQLTPREILDLLRILLLLHNRNFETSDVGKLSGLVCAVVVTTGEYIWASREEILAHGPELQLILDYPAQAGTVHPRNVVAELPGPSLQKISAAAPKDSARGESGGTGILQLVKHRLCACCPTRA